MDFFVGMLPTLRTIRSDLRMKVQRNPALQFRNGASTTFQHQLRKEPLVR